MVSNKKNLCNQMNLKGIKIISSDIESKPNFDPKFVKTFMITTVRAKDVKKHV